MKKMLIAAMVTMALVACSKNEAPQQVPVEVKKTDSPWSPAPVTGPDLIVSLEQLNGVLGDRNAQGRVKPIPNGRYPYGVLKQYMYYMKDYHDQLYYINGEYTDAQMERIDFAASLIGKDKMAEAVNDALFSYFERIGEMLPDETPVKINDKYKKYFLRISLRHAFDKMSIEQLDMFKAKYGDFCDVEAGCGDIKTWNKYNAGKKK